MRSKSSWHAWTDREWRDKVADTDEELGRFDQDLDAFVDDIKQIARMVVEVTIEPIKVFAESFPRAMAYDSKHWRHAWTGARRSSRHR